MTRPTFTHVIEALRTTDPRFPWVGPTDDEAEAAVVLEALEHTHQPRRDSDGAPCAGCDEPWPCPAWEFGEQQALLWLGRAADRVYRHAMDTYRKSQGAA